MANLDLSQVLDFVKATKDDKNEYNPSYLYGTIVIGDSEVVYVQPDGSDELAPVHVNELGTSAKFNDGDRVILQIQNNELIVTGNISNPSALEYTDSDLQDALSRVGIDTQISEYGIYISKPGSQFGVVINNEGINMYAEDTAVAYMNNNAMLITESVIKETLTLGNYKFVPRTDGSMYLMWVDSSSEEVPNG